MGISIGGVPCHRGPRLDGNDPLLLCCLWNIISIDCMVLVYRSKTIALNMLGSADMMSLVVNGGVNAGCCTVLVFISGCVH